ncbi:MAG: hypothetical protein GY750_14205 [Lentisphaerae bacterium]|nr:hypothetical protein [Lentisphaerota bacterium]MCP4102553.1 hypothetical protein [Lentisphaerota bacterium]
MAASVATLGSVTATGDSVIGTCATILRNCMPCATLGSVVTGTACIGTIISTTSVTTIRMGLPVACICDVVSGTSTAGVPVVTTVGSSIAPAIIR